MSQLVKTKRQANLKILSDLEPLRGSSNKKTLYSTRSYVNWMPNLHTNSLNKLLHITVTYQIGFQTWKSLKPNIYVVFLYFIFFQVWMKMSY
jgi:hypothetical protein